MGYSLHENERGAIVFRTVKRIDWSQIFGRVEICGPTALFHAFPGCRQGIPGFCDHLQGGLVQRAAMALVFAALGEDC